jgi:signal transduction histidine kinase
MTEMMGGWSQPVALGAAGVIVALAVLSGNLLLEHRRRQQAEMQARHHLATMAQGMGLSIARSIVEAHRGEIQAENNPDKGATVRFTIPVASSRGRAHDQSNVS